MAQQAHPGIYIFGGYYRQEKLTPYATVRPFLADQPCEKLSIDIVGKK